MSAMGLTSVHRLASYPLENEGDRFTDLLCTSREEEPNPVAKRASVILVPKAMPNLVQSLKGHLLKEVSHHVPDAIEGQKETSVQ